jgi:hypothetical protein
MALSSLVASMPASYSAPPSASSRPRSSEARRQGPFSSTTTRRPAAGMGRGPSAWMGGRAARKAAVQAAEVCLQGTQPPRAPTCPSQHARRHAAARAAAHHHHVAAHLRGPPQLSSAQGTRAGRRAHGAAASTRGALASLSGHRQPGGVPSTTPLDRPHNPPCRPISRTKQAAAAASQAAHLHVRALCGRPAVPIAAALQQPGRFLLAPSPSTPPAAAQHLEAPLPQLVRWVHAGGQRSHLLQVRDGGLEDLQEGGGGGR